MNEKEALKQYIDACELIKETELDIQRLEAKKNRVVSGSVKGSMKEFPYIQQNFHYSGSEYLYTDDKALIEERQILKDRRAAADKLRIEAQKIINHAPPRIQRIIRFYYQERLSWNQVAEKMGRKCSGDSVRMELERYLKEK